MTKIHTHYDNLKVARDAPDAVIRAAYKALVQKYHPDKNPGDMDAARIMQVINQSYKVLSNPESRAKYDARIAREEAARASQGASSNAGASYKPPPPPPPPPGQGHPHQEPDESGASTRHQAADDGKAFYRKFLDGDFGLATTYWLFGVIPMFFPNLILSATVDSLWPEHRYEFLIFIALPYMAYWITWAIGCWHAANKYRGASVWRILTHTSLVIGWIIICLLFLAFLASEFDNRQPTQRSATTSQASARPSYTTTQPATSETQSRQTTPPSDERWLTLRAHEGREHSIDTHSIQRDGNNVKVWVQTNNETPQRSEINGYIFYVSRTLFRITCHCEGHAVSGGTFITYDQSGEVIESSDGHGKVIPIIPGSMPELVCSSACSPH